MKKHNRKNKKETRGITLIALVVTIVILLILAGVSINLVLGPNGLITRAQEAGMKTELEIAREKLTLALADVYIEKQVTMNYEDSMLEELVAKREPEAVIFEEGDMDYISLNGYIFQLNREVPELGEYDGTEANRPPRVYSINVENKTMSKIEISVHARMPEGGKLRYSIKRAGQEDTTYEVGEPTTEITNIFDNLTSPETYTIRVELLVGEAVQHTLTKEVKLGELVEGNIEFGQVTWEGVGKASTTIKTNTSYQLQYQKVTGENGPVEGSWINITTGGAITDIANNTKIYARLIEGTRASESKVIEVKDEIDPTISEIKKIGVTETTIKIQVIAEDKESGIAKIEYSKDNGSNYVTGTNVTSTEYEFTQLEDGTEYAIKVRVTDGAGNPAELGKSIITDGERFSKIYTTTTKYTDSEGNIAWIPGGFAVGVDEDINKVSGGLVIQDSEGNQFVWIPTGEYKTATGEIKTNELTRRKWAAENVVQEPTVVEGDAVIDRYYYGEGDSRSIASGSIKAFLDSAKPVSEGGRGGFYIGRYEQGQGNVCKAGVEVLSLTRDEANGKAREMYSGKSEVKATSQLISSYAWDTALNFMCQTNEWGYELATISAKNLGIASWTLGAVDWYKTGEDELDRFCNIYDFVGGEYEFTTEYGTRYTTHNGKEYYPAVFRGGSPSGSYFAANRQDYWSYVKAGGFRIQLYV